MSNQTRSCKINPHILRYIEMVEKGEIKACLDHYKLVAHVRRFFETEYIFTDDTQLSSVKPYGLPQHIGIIQGTEKSCAHR